MAPPGIRRVYNVYRTDGQLLARGQCREPARARGPRRHAVGQPQSGSGHRQQNLTRLNELGNVAGSGLGHASRVEALLAVDRFDEAAKALDGTWRIRIWTRSKCHPPFGSSIRSCNSGACRKVSHLRSAVAGRGSLSLWRRDEHPATARRRDATRSAAGPDPCVGSDLGTRHRARPGDQRTDGDGHIGTCDQGGRSGPHDRSGGDRRRGEPLGSQRRHIRMRPQHAIRQARGHLHRRRRGVR